MENEELEAWRMMRFAYRRYVFPFDANTENKNSQKDKISRYATETHSKYVNQQALKVLAKSRTSGLRFRGLTGSN